MKTSKVLFASTLLTAACLSPLPAMAHQAGDWLVRVGAANVNPDADSGPIKAADGSVVVPAGAVDVDDNTQLGLTITNMITDNFGVELLAATPFKHDLVGKGPLGPLGKIGETKHLPPTLSAQWHFLPAAQVQPYVGVGINWTKFFDEDASSSLEGALGDTKISLDDSLGFAVQAGLDVDLQNGWFLGAAVWYADIDTEASLRTAGAGKLKVDVDIDPTVYMLSVGKKF